MKNLIIVGLFVFSFNIMAENTTPKNEEDLINSAIKNGYQEQRNLAFDYQTGSTKYGGSGLVAKNETKSCAWRKILLIANPEKTSASDPENERFSCRNLDFKQDEEVWKIVYNYLPMINDAKAKGEYMVKKEDPISDEIIIIDVDTDNY